MFKQKAGVFGGQTIRQQRGTASRNVGAVLVLFRVQVRIHRHRIGRDCTKTGKIGRGV